MKKILFLPILFSQLLFAQIKISDQATKGAFPIATKTSVTTILYDTNDYPVVAKSVHLFASDIKRVCQKISRNLYF